MEHNLIASIAEGLDTPVPKDAKMQLEATSNQTLS